MKTKLVAITAFSAALALIASITPAHAIDGAWRVGPNYVITTADHDLGSADGRASFLTAIETAAARLCVEEGTRVARERCAEAAISQTLQAMPARVRASVAEARSERNAVQLAATR